MNTKLLYIILIFITTITLCSCTNNNRNNLQSDTTESSGIVTQDIKPIAGKVYKDNILDISDNINYAIGEDYLVCDCVFINDNTLLTAAENANETKLFLYDITTSSISGSYSFPFSISLSKSLSSTGVISVGENTICVINVFTGNITILNHSLENQMEFVVPTLSLMEGAKGEVCLAYCESNNSILYCNITEASSIYKYDISNKSEKKIFESINAGDIITFSPTQDGKYLNITEYGDYQQPTNSTININLILDTSTEKITNSTWLNLIAYSNNDEFSYSKGYYSTARLFTANNEIKLNYLDEYNQVCLSYNNNQIITGVSVTDGYKYSLMLSCYDINTNVLISRQFFDSASWFYFSKGIFSNSIGTYNDKRAAFCFGIDVGYQDKTIRKTYIWTPKNKIIEDNNIDILISQPEYSLPKEYSQQTVSELINQIESKYSITILYGDLITESIGGNTIDQTTLKSFGSDVDYSYIYECVMQLKLYLSRYPEGMIKKISTNSRGKLNFFLVTDIKNNNLDFDIAGQYIEHNNQQYILIRMYPSSLYDILYQRSNTGMRSIVDHEICHAIQQCIFVDNTGDTIYDTDTYLSFYPKDFEFNKEDNFEKYVNSEPENVYFPDDYAMTGILEDMSRMFEYAMWDDIPENMYYPHIRARFEYLCKLIRSAFNDLPLNEPLPWERVLQPKSVTTESHTSNSELGG